METYLEYVVCAREGTLIFGRPMLQPMAGYALLAQAIMEYPQEAWRLQVQEVLPLEVSVEGDALREAQMRGPLRDFSLMSRGDDVEGEEESPPPAT